MDHGVLATANELFAARHYPSVIAVVSSVLDGDPECLPLLLLRARANIALRRDLEAQADLRDIIRIEPGRGVAFRLLGELAARRDEHAAAAGFFREAIRLDPSDREANDWLAIIDHLAPPGEVDQATTATHEPGGQRPSRPVASPVAEATPRLAKGTYPPDDDGVTPPLERVRSSCQAQHGAAPRSDHHASTLLAPAPALGALARGSRPAPAHAPNPTLEIPSLPGPVCAGQRAQAGQPTAPRRAVGVTPELAGFGEFLVATGILTRERLRAAQAYQRSMKVQLSTAIVTLGLATPQRIEWAAVSHQSHVARAG